MAFSVPVMPLLCNITQPDFPNSPGIPTPPYRLVDVPCNLAWGRRTNSASSGGTGSPGTPISCIDLLLPKLTDIRGPQDDTSADVVECPAGSGRWYFVVAVDDVAKGFSNEYRLAVLFAIAGTWVAPYQ